MVFLLFSLKLRYTTVLFTHDIIISHPDTQMISDFKPNPYCFQTFSEVSIILQKTNLDFFLPYQNLPVNSHISMDSDQSLPFGPQVRYSLEHVIFPSHFTASLTSLVDTTQVICSSCPCCEINHSTLRRASSNCFIKPEILWWEEPSEDV